MPPRGSDGDKDIGEHNRIRQALPPIRTFLGTELALPLPLHSANSPSPSCGSAFQTCESPAAQTDYSMDSEPRHPFRSYGTLPDFGFNQDADIRGPETEGMRDSSLVTAIRSQTSTPSASHSATIEGSNLDRPEDKPEWTPGSLSNRALNEISSIHRHEARLFRRQTAGSEGIEGTHIESHSHGRRRGATLALSLSSRSIDNQPSRDMHSQPYTASGMEFVSSSSRPARVADSPMSIDTLLSPERGSTRLPQLRTRAFTLPPPRGVSDNPASHYYSLTPSFPLSHARTSPPQSSSSTATTTPPFSYNVLRPSHTGGELITSTPIRSRARSRSMRLSQPGASTSSDVRAESEGPRKHECPICHKLFNRPSSLRTHTSVHTGSRPFACPHPGCNKAFSVASNMRRHLRKHFQGSGTIGARGGASEGEADAEEPEGL